MEKNLYINASELAIWIDRNPYENRLLQTLRIWRRFFKDNYENAKKEYFEIFQKNAFEHFDSKEKEKHLESKINLSIQKITNEETKNIQNTKETLEKHDSIFKKILEESKQNGIELNETDIKTLEQSVQKNLKTNFGIQKESPSLDWYEQTFKKKLIRNPSLSKKKWIEVDDWNIYIQGKFDGMEEDLQTIIEIKNRMRGCFKILKPYEQVQVDAYHYIFNVPNVHLIECWRKKDDKCDYHLLTSKQNQDRWIKIQEDFLEWFITFKNMLENKNRDSVRYQVFQNLSEDQELTWSKLN